MTVSPALTSLRQTLEHAVENGPVNIAIGGGLGERRPQNLISVLHSLPPRSVDLWMLYAGPDDSSLLESVAIRRLNVSYLSPRTQLPRDTTGLPREFAVAEWPEWLFLTLFRSAALGIPFLPYRLASLPQGQSWSTITYNDEDYRAVPIPAIDGALIQVEQTDSQRNANFSPDDRFLCELDIAMATCARLTALETSSVSHVPLPSPDISAADVELVELTERGDRRG